MGNAPFVFVGWMTVSMMVVGAGLHWGWSLWSVGGLGLCLIIGAYVTTAKIWRQHSGTTRMIQETLHELESLTEHPTLHSSRSPSSDSWGPDFQQIVDDIKTRIGNLEKERAEISGIVENLVDGVVAFDHQGQVLFANVSACRILGIPEQQLQGLSVWEVIRNTELAEFVEKCRNLSFDDRARVEVNTHTPARLTIEVYGLPFSLANQEKGSVIVLHDVTQLRRLEHVRAEFIDNVSHEIRTPLAAIIGYLETLIDEPSLETPNNRKFVQVAHQHAERLNRLVDDLRSLSEIESGKVILRWEAVDLKSVVDEVTEMLRSQGQKKGLQFCSQIEEAVEVWADRDRVVQILLNLVDNAIKYSFEGGTISFHVQRLEKSIVLQVKDTGQGIPSTDLPRITERFYRVDRARSREEGGTGLGLSIVKHLVQLLGGQLRIHSELGKGTNIELDLPVPSHGNMPASSE